VLNKEKTMREITIPIDDAIIRSLHVGEPVELTGVMVTGRDAAHKWMVETFIQKTRPPQGDDLQVYENIRKYLDHGVLYHCGPVVSGLETKEYRFVAAGPTTSSREEPYQADVMKHFNLKGVIGKGGMGPKTLQGCLDTPGVYFHAIGGAASFLAQTVQRVLGVYKLEAFGVPEAMWVIAVKNFPVVVTMDSHGKSKHSLLDESSRQVLQELLARPY
jgi:fumarate hydratase class I